jgi:outer membrane protein insertion porin family
LFSVSSNNNAIVFPASPPAGFRTVILTVIALLFLLSALLQENRAAAETYDETASTASPSLPGAGSRDVEPFRFLFQGNTSFSEKQLRSAAKNELADFERLGHRKAEADDAAYQMELAYKRAGFAFARVDYRYEAAVPAPRLTFTVQEGPQVLVKNIVFTGNAFFATPELQQYFRPDRNGFFRPEKLFYVETTIETALADIRDLYYEAGFPDVQVLARQPEFAADRSSVTLFIAINENVRSLIQKITFSGDLLPQTQTGLDAIVADLEGKPYFSRRKLLIKSRVLEIYGNLGYPDVGTVIAKQTGENPGDVILAVTITSGPQIIISATKVSGNRKTKSSFITNRLQLGEGDTYSLTGQRESFHALYQTGLFSRVALQLEDTSEPGKRILAVDVAETSSREVSLEAGWGSYELLRVGFGFRDRNFLGTGRIIRTEGRFSLKSESLLTGITDPWFFRTDIVADFPVYYSRREEPSFNRQDIGAGLLFSKKMSKVLTATLGYSLRWTDTRSIDIVAPQESAQLDPVYNIASIKTQVTWDTRNDLFFPSSGARNFISAEIADSLIGSGVNLARFTAGSRYFWPLTKTVTLGLRGNTGFIIPGRGQVTIPLPERFFNGGENTVRSFQESELGPQDLAGNPVGGLAFNVVNLELRRRFASNIVLTLFTDLGNVSPNQSRIEEGQPAFTDRAQLIDTMFKEYFRDFRAAVGVGLQYLLPVGPVRLDLALNPAPRPERNEDRYTIHFGMGMAF